MAYPKLEFEVQVNYFGEWKSIKPVGEKPYRFDTREKAEKFIDLWYPMSDRENFQIISIEEYGI